MENLKLYTDKSRGSYDKIKYCKVFPLDKDIIPSNFIDIGNSITEIDGVPFAKKDKVMFGDCSEVYYGEILAVYDGLEDRLEDRDWGKAADDYFNIRLYTDKWVPTDYQILLEGEDGYWSGMQHVFVGIVPFEFGEDDIRQVVRSDFDL